VYSNVSLSLARATHRAQTALHITSMKEIDGTRVLYTREVIPPLVPLTHVQHRHIFAPVDQLTSSHETIYSIIRIMNAIRMRLSKY